MRPLGRPRNRREYNIMMIFERVRTELMWLKIWTGGRM